MLRYFIAQLGLDCGLEASTSFARNENSNIAFGSRMSSGVLRNARQHTIEREFKNACERCTHEKGEGGPFSLLYLLFSRVSSK